MNTATFAPYAVDQTKKAMNKVQNPPGTGGFTPATNGTQPNTPPSQGPQSTPQAPAVPQPTQAPTFAQLQAAGQARPAPPPMQATQVQAPPAAGIAPGGNTARGLLQQLMDNPSSYNSEAMNREYQNKGMAIDDEYTLGERNLEGEMARRGIFDSNIAGDRTRGLLLAKRDAKTSLAESLLQKLADTQSADRRAAASLGLETEHGDRALSLQAAGLSQRGNQFERELALDRERFDFSRNQFDRQMDEERRQYDLGRGDRRHEFDTSSIADLVELLGGYEGLGSLFGGGGSSAPSSSPIRNPDPVYPSPVMGGGGGGGGLTAEELLNLLQF